MKDIMLTRRVTNVIICANTKWSLRSLMEMVSVVISQKREEMGGRNSQ